MGTGQRGWGRGWGVLGSEGVRVGGLGTGSRGVGGQRRLGVGGLGLGGLGLDPLANRSPFSNLMLTPIPKEATEIFINSKRINFKTH